MVNALGIAKILILTGWILLNLLLSTLPVAIGIVPFLVIFIRFLKKGVVSCGNDRCTMEILFARTYSGVGARSSGKS